MSQIKENIEAMIDEMILREYKGKNHILARDHYRKLLGELIPKYFVPVAMNDTRPGERR